MESKMDNSETHGEHQVAQKSRITHFPLKSEKSMTLVGNWITFLSKKPGQGLPMSGRGLADVSWVFPLSTQQEIIITKMYLLTTNFVKLISGILI
jgi:hypothetical protein